MIQRNIGNHLPSTIPQEQRFTTFTLLSIFQHLFARARSTQQRNAAASSSTAAINEHNTLTLGTASCCAISVRNRGGRFSTALRRTGSTDEKVGKRVSRPTLTNARKAPIAPNCSRISASLNKTASYCSGSS